MKQWLVTYDGLWLGGKAVVVAASQQEAEELVRNHKSTVKFNNVFTAELGELSESCVLYNDNGDY